MPEISVIIPYKDRLDWVQAAVKSVLEQSFQDFELILVDDGSEVDHASQFEKLDRRILHLRQTNRGPAAARNAGIQRSSGVYIAFLDSDDLFLPEKLATQINLMKQHQVMFSHTSYRHIAADGQILDDVHSGQFGGDVYPEIYQSCPIATPTVMLHRSLLDEFRFPEHLRLAEDIILWSRISAKNRLLGIDLPLTSVRLHGSNAAFDGAVQIRGIQNIIRDGVLADTRLGLVKKRLILSNLHVEIARHQLLQKNFSSYIQQWMIAFGYAPLNLRIYRLAAISLLPETLRSRLKSYIQQRRSK